MKLMRATESDLASRCHNLVTADGALHVVLVALVGKKINKGVVINF
jgi:hypothetical protein